MRPAVWAACLAMASALGGCRSEPTAEAPRRAAPASEVREGDWLGGPEDASGKLPSGLVAWWRLRPARPEPGQVFELTVRIEEAGRPDASVGIGTSSGATLADAADAGPWAIPAGAPSDLRVRLMAPPGDSYVHLALRQGDRLSMRTILLPLAGRNPAEAARQRNDYALDPAGEPIVRMRAEGQR